MTKDNPGFEGQVSGNEYCIPYKGCKSKKGYGRRRVLGKLELAHRVSWRESYGEIPPGMFVLHRCNNPACCNPEHLYLGTNADNVAYKVACGRQGRIFGNTHTRGSKCKLSVLNEEQVVCIMARLLTGRESQTEISRCFGVSPMAITHIWKGDRWGWLFNEEE